MERTSGATSLDVVPLSRPYRATDELANLETVLRNGHAHGDGEFTARASGRLKRLSGSANVLLTTSATHALEMASSLLDIGPGDEVVLPSFTFPSAADAVARTGARCVFVDLDPATGNLDPAGVAEAIGPRTKAISIMHYGGVPVAGEIQAIAAEHGLPIIEDNAHGLGVPGLGTIGVLAAQSFHDTKNVHCGEGGALFINDPELLNRAEIMREKGTNRSQFLRGQIDKYSWMDWGSSYLPSEFNAAVLDAQLSEFGEIQRLRTAVWDRYWADLAAWAAENGIGEMTPPGGIHASHLFYLLMPTWAEQTRFIAHLRMRGVQAAFHYVPLDSSPAGLRYGRTLHALDLSEDFSRRLVRLPLWAGMDEDAVSRVVEAALEYRVNASA